MKASSTLIPSSTVILLRQGEDSIESLLLQKNKAITFGGSWVFPGGRLEGSDFDTDLECEYASEASAVVRECVEETGLEINPANLIPLSCWITPVIRPKRFKTIFFIYDATHLSDKIKIDQGEIVDWRWMPIDTAVKQHQAKELVLSGPAFVTLSEFAVYNSLENLIDTVTPSSVKPFAPRVQLSRTGAICLYHGDECYELLNDHHTSDDEAMLEKIENCSQKHRLYMDKLTAWKYVHSLTD